MDNADKLKWYHVLGMIAYAPIHKVKMCIAKRYCKKHGHDMKPVNYGERCQRCNHFNYIGVDDKNA